MYGDFDAQDSLTRKTEEAHKLWWPSVTYLVGEGMWVNQQEALVVACVSVIWLVEYKERA